MEVRFTIPEGYALPAVHCCSIPLIDLSEYEPPAQLRSGMESGDRYIKASRYNLTAQAHNRRMFHRHLLARPWRALVFAISASMLGAMALEDVRNLKDEIYARHGRVFKTTWLQSYFASLPWYQPNANYADSMLNPTERSNIAYLDKLQTKLQKEMSMEEG